MAYDGPERRKDYLELDGALQEVERLHSAVTTLATAVTNTVPRAELEALKKEVHRDYLLKLYFMAGFTAIGVILIVVFMNMKVNNLSKSTEHNHAIIQCLQGKPEAARTGDLAATALLTCEQTTR